MKRIARFFKDLIIAKHALAYGKSRGLVGIDFAEYGRSLAFRLYRMNPQLSRTMLITPLVGPRYFEFDFAWSSLKENPGICADVSSPFLFSLRVAETFRNSKVFISNPDRSDIATTEKLAKNLGILNIQCESHGVEALAGFTESFDTIWSLSVIEHISGKDGDSDAVTTMYNSLRPGGRLVLTFPVTKFYREDHVTQDPYGTQSKLENGKFFYQRWYDARRIQTRIISRLKNAQISFGYYGERESGTLVSHERSRVAHGRNFTARYPKLMATDFQIYDSWDAMPGDGVCGLIAEKPYH
ncbi:hypothetical protein V7x_25650 [Crateriforma conspicua]|uniref:Methyltransferase type 11 domain-containing protein n=1 Tax=Crateriforma conspicua TaxID=2527996 RepID=A0A5C6G1E4_9PLAN|nr:class I SAM-dependent methyltransferase [Crateriforma conspicua]TWU66993.1 hypothetical protein V7x_25650 [Crateriforma conspicua]